MSLGRLETQGESDVTARCAAATSCMWFQSYCELNDQATAVRKARAGLAQHLRMAHGKPGPFPKWKPLPPGHSFQLWERRRIKEAR